LAARLSQTAASLAVIGDNRDPEKVTRVLGKSPDVARRKGQTWLSRKGSPLQAHTGIWQVMTARREPGDLDGQIAELLDGTTDDLTVWLDLSRRFQMFVDCGLSLVTRNEGLMISAPTMALLGSRGIALDFDIYAPWED